MGGLFAALALRQSGAFTSVDLYEQTKTPGTAGAGLNIPPNGALLCKWLGVDLDGGDPKCAHGAVDGGRAAILDATRLLMPGGTVPRKPINQNSGAQTVTVSDRTRQGGRGCSQQAGGVA